MNFCQLLSSLHKHIPVLGLFIAEILWSQELEFNLQEQRNWLVFDLNQSNALKTVLVSWLPFTLGILWLDYRLNGHKQINKGGATINYTGYLKVPEECVTWREQMVIYATHPHYRKRCGLGAAGEVGSCSRYGGMGRKHALIACLANMSPRKKG